MPATATALLSLISVVCVVGLEVRAMAFATCTTLVAFAMATVPPVYAALMRTTQQLLVRLHAPLEWTVKMFVAGARLLTGVVSVVATTHRAPVAKTLMRATSAKLALFPTPHIVVIPTQIRTVLATVLYLTVLVTAAAIKGTIHVVSALVTEVVAVLMQFPVKNLEGTIVGGTAAAPRFVTCAVFVAVTTARALVARLLQPATSTRWQSLTMTPVLSLSRVRP